MEIYFFNALLNSEENRACDKYFNFITSDECELNDKDKAQEYCRVMNVSNKAQDKRYEDYFGFSFESIEEDDKFSEGVEFKDNNEHGVIESEQLFEICRKAYGVHGFEKIELKAVFRKGKWFIVQAIER